MRVYVGMRGTEREAGAKEETDTSGFSWVFNILGYCDRFVVLQDPKRYNRSMVTDTFPNFSRFEPIFRESRI